MEVTLLTVLVFLFAGFWATWEEFSFASVTAVVALVLAVQAAAFGIVNVALGLSYGYDEAQRWHYFFADLAALCELPLLAIFWGFLVRYRLTLPPKRMVTFIVLQFLIALASLWLVSDIPDLNWI